MIASRGVNDFSRGKIYIFTPYYDRVNL